MASGDKGRSGSLFRPAPIRQLTTNDRENIMTTRVIVEANHGWPVKVQFVNPKTGNTVGPERIVPPAAKEEFYIHSTMDLRVHEVQPGEGSEAEDLDPEAA